MLHYVRGIVVGATLFSVASAAPLRAQRVDTTRVALPGSAFDTLRAPIGPRRAFLYSFLAPGYSQTVLGRHKAAAAFLLTEAISLVMIRESAADVREARRAANDSLVLSYVDANGALAVTKIRNRFGDDEVRSRRAHVEDWIAFLVANHLFAGADAFVAAHLWDLPVRLSLRELPGTGNTAIVAAIRW